jgi:hypothetical protein
MLLKLEVHIFTNLVLFDRDTVCHKMAQCLMNRKRFGREFATVYVKVRTWCPENIREECSSNLYREHLLENRGETRT